MTERERLVKLLDQSPAHFCDGCKESPEERAESIEKLADYLIEQGCLKDYKDIDGLRHYLRLNEDIAIQHKREGRPETEEYWKGKLAAFAQVEGYIRHEIDRVRRLEE